MPSLVRSSGSPRQANSPRVESGHSGAYALPTVIEQTRVRLYITKGGTDSENHDTITE